MGVIVNNEQDEIKIQDSLIKTLTDITTRILSFHGRSTAEVGITLTDTETIHRLNKDFRSIDAPTDVLSFPLDGTDEEIVITKEEGLPDLLGDVVISIPRAREQAEDYGHSLEREVLYLAVHGILHLLGYDHEDEAERRRMREKEEYFLSEEGWPRTNE